MNEPAVNPGEAGDGERCSVDLGIGGMTCASCSARVERALRKVPGVQQATVNLATESARVVVAGGDPQVVARLARAVREAGYEPRTPEQMQAAADEGPWAGFGPVALALALSAPLVLPMLLQVFGVHVMLPPWLQFLLATPVQFVLGARFYKAGWSAARHGSGNMDLLVAIGTTAGWLLSVWLWWTAPAGETPHLYFEGSAVVIALVLLGKWLKRAPRGGRLRRSGRCMPCGLSRRIGSGPMGRSMCRWPNSCPATGWWCGRASASRPMAAWSKATPRPTNRS